MGTTRSYVWDLPYAQVTFAVSAGSDTGLVRKVNEDSFVATPPIFLVADGMGGHAFGDRASQETARVLGAQLPGDEPVTSRRVLDAVEEANRAVKAISGDDFAGTTLTGIALVQAVGAQTCNWMVFNVGDSRVYSWDGSALTQVSVDHSAVQELVDDGAITAEQAAGHPERNVITRAIGIDSDLEPDVWLLPAEGSHSFVICSDGLTKELDDRAIEAVMAAVESDESHADRLVAAALASGGADNVTVVVVESTVTLTPSALTADSDALPAHLEVTHPRP